MGLFHSSPEQNESPVMTNQSNSVQDQVNLVGEGTVLEGTLTAEHDVRASGHLIGTLRVEGKAMISEEGSIEGQVFATHADVAGHVDGELHVDGRLVLKSSARVEGLIETERLVVEEGAEFTGECNMDGGIAMEDENAEGVQRGGDEVGSGSWDDEEPSEEDASLSAVEETE